VLKCLIFCFRQKFLLCSKVRVLSHPVRLHFHPVWAHFHPVWALSTVNGPSFQEEGPFPQCLAWTEHFQTINQSFSPDWGLHDTSKQVYWPHRDQKGKCTFLSKVAGYMKFVPGHILTLSGISLRCVSIFWSWM